MTTLIKSPDQIKIMTEGGKKLSLILKQLIQMSKVGVNLLDIEKKAIQLIKDSGGKPAFTRVANYHWATCLNVNDEIVHAPPKNYSLKANDVLNIDIGLYYQGFNTDMSSTFRVQTQNSKLKTQIYKENRGKDTSEVKSLNTSEVEGIDRFLETGKKALKAAIAQARSGNRVADISQKIQQIVEEAGYNVCRNLTGHGIGRTLHEPPHIPCFVKDKQELTPLLKSGMTVAIEVIYMMGKPDLVVDPQVGWTMKTKDGKISAVFEETIAVTSNDCLILSRLP